MSGAGHGHSAEEHGGPHNRRMVLLISILALVLAFAAIITGMMVLAWIAIGLGVVGVAFGGIGLFAPLAVHLI